MKILNKSAPFVILILLSALSVKAQTEKHKYYPETDTAVLRKLEHWQDIKFGLLMHWGPYSQWGIVESWSICSEDEDWCKRKSDNYEQYKKDYENLKTTFNPVKFDPSKWAEAAAYAGMRYVVFTTKHHDGFCMFDTKTTDYKVTDPGCPFHTNPKANITKEVFDAFRAKGFLTGAYFSKPDWHCPYYWWPNFATPDRNCNYNIKKYPDRWEDFVQYTHTQIDELMTNYDTVDILWLDGGWVRSYSKEELFQYRNKPDLKPVNLQSQDIRMNEIVKKAREKQPGLIVVDRTVKGTHQNYLTPENRVPENAIYDYPWESCIIAGGGWSYSFNATYKSGHEAVRLLVDIVAKGGNLLLNIAPSPEGELDQDAYDMLKELGDWMKVNSECIYNTRAYKPYKVGKIYYTKHKDGDFLYAVYMADEDETTLPEKIMMYGVNLPGKIAISLLGSDLPVTWERSGKGILINIPDALISNPPCKYAWCFKIKN